MNPLGLSTNITNPFYSGCLHQKLPGWENQLRVCNRYDPPNAAGLGLCRAPPFDYLEIRIGTGNWDSATLLGWLTQIVLSEILGVPTSTEANAFGSSRDFYDPTARIDYDRSVGPQPLVTASELADGDCRVFAESNQNPTSEYTACAHFYPEFWGTETQFVLEKKIEPPQGIGFLGQEHWYVTKFTADEFPEFVSYHGLKAENREKVAATFKRPTTWGDYCAQVSLNNCTEPDKVAQRAPQDETEEERMFVEDLYTGHFRYTDKNNCTMFPDNCTGHIANYPCGWSSNMESYIHHENIPLDANNAPGGGPNGYSVTQLMEMWTAANYTRENLLMMWWSPEPLQQRFVGTDAEFQHVMLKPYNLECDEARSVYKDECSDNITERLGTPDMSCDNPAEPLRKMISGGLYDVLNDPNIPEASRSPAYDVLRLFQITQVQLGELFDMWESAENPREGVCTWAANNFDFLNSTVPFSYPRVTREESFSPLGYVSLSTGCLATLLVIVTFGLVRHKRDTPSIQFAQFDFLSILLAGSFLVSLGAIVSSLPASNATCITTIWFVYVGYTLELVPLIIKVAAINRMMEAARELRRITLHKHRLFRGVAMVCVPVVAVLIAWTIVDPPQKMAELSLTNDITSRGESVVAKSYYCNGGESDTWRYVGLGWNAVLLLCASVLAFQTRQVVKNFNESRTLAFLIYSHFVFVILRIATFMLSDKLDGGDLDYIRSILYAVDQMTACVIYFLPKLYFKDSGRSGSPPTGSMETSSFRTNNAMMSAERTGGWNNQPTSPRKASGSDELGGSSKIDSIKEMPLEENASQDLSGAVEGLEGTIPSSVSKLSSSSGDVESQATS